MLGTVAPAASANIVKSPSLLNDAGHSAAYTHGFLLGRSLLFLSKISSAVSTKNASRSAIAERLYILRRVPAKSYGPGEQQKPAADCRAHTEGERGGREAYGKAKEVVEEGKERGSLTPKGFEKKVEVDGRKHLVRVIDGDAELEESQGGKKLLRIKITAEVDGVKSDYTITFSSGKINAAMGRAYASAKAPGGG